MRTRAPKILLIDDDPNGRALYLSALLPLGCCVIEAGNGRDGYECFSQEGADLVISVDSLGDGTGLQMVKKIRQADGGVPVLFLKRNGQDDLDDEAKKLGGCKVLREPFYPRQLRTVVEAALHQG